MNFLHTVARQVKSKLQTFGAVTRKPRQHVSTSCVNINALLMHLCNFDQAMYAYVLKWLAYPLRYEGAKMSNALVINGPLGTGAGLFFDRVVAELYEDDARCINEYQLRARFNPWAEAAKFVTVEGHFTNDSAQALKPLITHGYYNLRKSNKMMKSVPNDMNFVFISGSADFIPVGFADRRFVIIEAPPARAGVFYRAVADEIENGGVDAFRQQLMCAVDLTGFHPHSKPPVDASPANAARAGATA